MGHRSPFGDVESSLLGLVMSINIFYYIDIWQSNYDHIAAHMLFAAFVNYQPFSC